MSRPLLILPPLAFARVGTSSQPVDWFLWGPNDNSLHGTGKTTVVRCSGFDRDGAPARANGSARVVFRDGNDIRPICPFFELYEEDERGDVRPVTPDMYPPDAVVWTVSLGNLKAYYRTGKDGDKIAGRLRVRASQPGRKVIGGWSPPSSRNPLVMKKSPIAMGEVEVLPARAGSPYRIRFWPPRGLVYAPRNIHKRTDAFSDPETLAEKRQDVVPILNPAAAWCKWEVDERQYLGRLTMLDGEGLSLGLVDDTSDGLVECRLPAGRRAGASIAVTPPYYAPDRRYLISCADGLKDREDRDEPLTADGESSEAWRSAAEELVIDILERALETVDFMNLEALVDRYEGNENPNNAFVRDQPWKTGAAGNFEVGRLREQTLETFPLTELARQKHRQFVSPDLLKRFIKQRPELLREILRPPVGDNQFFNRQMPPLQRGSDARPLHLTRRQYDLLQRWAQSIGGI